MNTNNYPSDYFTAWPANHNHFYKVMESWKDDLLNGAGFIVYDQLLEEILAKTADPHKSETL